MAILNRIVNINEIDIMTHPFIADYTAISESFRKIQKNFTIVGPFSKKANRRYLKFYNYQENFILFGFVFHRQAI